ncbi:MAG: phosphate ABC transporter permease subunit PstC [Microbacteriaceae bacterium]|nr:phosphate ABC transporter permease subunit PstC [Microbacteriaceae bacterium]
MSSTDTAPAPTPQKTSTVRRAGDTVFQVLSTTSGVLILATLAAVFFFLLMRGFPSLVSPVQEVSDNYRANAGGFWPFVMPLVFGTVWASLLAMMLALPVGIAVALFISHFSSRRLAGPLGFVVDMLAAVPSVVFGPWGILVFAPLAGPLYRWLSENMGWFPLFADDPVPSGRNMMTAAIVLAIMILPIITSLSREIFLQTPRLHEEASLALGATRWEMVQQAVFPYARSGIFAASILALGRALGETMAIAMVLSATGVVSFAVLTEQNPTTIAGFIANNYPEAHGMDSNTLIAAGLVLFAITLLVNSIGRWVIARGKK